MVFAADSAVILGVAIKDVAIIVVVEVVVVGGVVVVAVVVVVGQPWASASFSI